MGDVLISLGKTAGLAGLGVGAFVWLFKDIIQRTVLSQLPPNLSYRILRLFVILVFLFSVIVLIVSLAGQYLKIQTA
jgi:hypothetical protein